MKQVTLVKRAEKSLADFRVILTDENDPTKQQTFGYKVKRLGNKAAMNTSLLMGEFAKDKSRDEIVGSVMIKEILDGTKPVGEAPALIDIFDNLDDEDFELLLTSLIETAKSSSVEG